jgi:hypothetical protein
VNSSILSANLKAHDDLILSHHFVIPNCDFDKLTLPHFGLISLSCLNKAISNQEDIRRNDKQAFW